MLNELYRERNVYGFVSVLITGGTRTTWSNQVHTERVKVRTCRSENRAKAKKQNQYQTPAANCAEFRANVNPPE